MANIDATGYLYRIELVARRAGDTTAVIHAGSVGREGVPVRRGRGQVTGRFSQKTVFIGGAHVTTEVGAIPHRDMKSSRSEEKVQSYMLVDQSAGVDSAVPLGGTPEGNTAQSRHAYIKYRNFSSALATHANRGGGAATLALANEDIPFIIDDWWWDRRATPAS